jgi:hypothetical protein
MIFDRDWSLEKHSFVKPKESAFSAQRSIGLTTTNSSIAVIPARCPTIPKNAERQREKRQKFLVPFAQKKSSKKTHTIAIVP